MEENDNRDGYYLRIDEKRILSTDEYLNLYAEDIRKNGIDRTGKESEPVEAGQSISSYSDIEK